MGAWYLEEHWMRTAAGSARRFDLVRFASSFDRPEKSPILKATSIRTIFARPASLAGHDKNGKPLDAYYGCGWSGARRPVRTGR